MSWLQIGDPVPELVLEDVRGRRWSLRDRRGRWLLVSVLRYAGCPFCGLRLAELEEQLPRWAAQGLEVVAVVASPRQRVVRLVEQRQLQVPIVADPDRTIHRRLGGRSSLVGYVRGLRPRLVKAMSRGFLPGWPEGDWAQLPLDLLVDPAGRVALIHYGRDVGDHVRPHRLQAAMRKVGTRGSASL